MVPPLPPKLRVYIYNATYLPGGRTMGEHKIQLIVPAQLRGERANRLEKEIAAHPVTRCKPGERPSSSRPGWSSKPFIPLSERTVAEGIAKKMMRKKT